MITFVILIPFLPLQAMRDFLSLWHFSDRPCNSLPFSHPRALNKVSFFIECSSFFGRFFMCFLFSKSGGETEGQRWGTRDTGTHSCFVSRSSFVARWWVSFSGVSFFVGCAKLCPACFPARCLSRVHSFFFFREAEFREERPLASSPPLFLSQMTPFSKYFLSNIDRS